MYWLNVFYMLALLFLLLTSLLSARGWSLCGTHLLDPISIHMVDNRLMTQFNTYKYNAFFGKSSQSNLLTCVVELIDMGWHDVLQQETEF